MRVQKSEYREVQGSPRYVKLKIPKDWDFLEISNVCDTMSGGTPSTTNPEYYNGNISWLTTSELKNNFVTETKYHITEEGLKNSSAKKIPPNSTIIAMYGATIGKTCINTTEMTTNQACCIFIPKKENLVDPYFLQQILIYFQPLIVSLAEGSGQPNINQNFLKKFKIPLQSTYHEQQKLLTRRIGHTKFKKVHWLFRKEIEIPEEWEWQQLLDNSILKGRIGWQGLTSSEYHEEGKFCLVTGTDFKDGRINWETCVYVDEERYSQDPHIQLKKHDILITKDGTIGKIAYVDTLPLPTTLNTGVFVVRPIDKKYLPLFLYYILHSDYFIKFITRIKAGSTISHLYQKDFVFFHFPVPSIPEQQKIASILLNLDLFIQQEKQYKEKLEKIKKGLLQQLLTGQKRVKV